MEAVVTALHLFTKAVVTAISKHVMEAIVAAECETLFRGTRLIGGIPRPDASLAPMRRLQPSPLHDAIIVTSRSRTL